MSTPQSELPYCQDLRRFMKPSNPEQQYCSVSNKHQTLLEYRYHIKFVIEDSRSSAIRGRSVKQRAWKAAKIESLKYPQFAAQRLS